MNSTENVYQQGETFCRSTGWMDVAKFFILNFGLHAVTVLTEPGSTPLACMMASFTAMLMPSVGVARAFDVISRFAIWGGTDLDVALRSGALCILVPKHPNARKVPRTEPKEVKEKEAAEKARAEGNTGVVDSEKTLSNSNTDNITKATTAANPPVREANDSEKTPSNSNTENITKATIMKATIAANPPGRDPYDELVLQNAYIDRLKRTFVPLSSDLTQVHGEYPRPLKSKGVHENDQSLETGPLPDPRYDDCSLIHIPPDFQVCPLVGPPNTKNRYEVIVEWFKRKLTPAGKPERAEGRISPASEITPTSPGSQKTSTSKLRVQETTSTATEETTLRMSKPGLACNFNFIKTIAAIIQILYGSFELYQVGKDQVRRYGYASYQVTVIPYVLMSLANLIAGLTGPRYPSRYIVHYRGCRRPLTENGSDSPEAKEIYPDGWWDEYNRNRVESLTSGAVGVVYGYFINPKKERKATQADLKRVGRLRLRAGGGETVQRKLTFRLIGRLGTFPKSRIEKGPLDYLLWLLSVAFLAAPYIILHLLTHYHEGASTRSQRSWIMCWFVLGQLGSIILSIIIEFSEFQKYTVRSPRNAFAITALITTLLSISTFGGFVVVTQMMLNDNTCQRL